MNSVEKILKLYPESKDIFEKIVKIHNLIGSEAIPPFFEKFELYELGKNPQPLFLTADIIATLINHVSFGTRVRMHSLEEGFFSELSKGRFMTAMILARSHMESAGLAAFTEQELVRASDSNNWDTFKLIINKILFGTSFRFERNIEKLQDELPLEATFPIKPKDLLEAMNGFWTSIGFQNSQLRGVYALLCEYAHPNIGGCKSFDKIINHENNSGWSHYYNSKEYIDNNSIRTAADILLLNMKIGYANTLLLVSGEIEELQNGVIYHKPSINIGNTIFNTILLA